MVQVTKSIPDEIIPNYILDIIMIILGKGNYPQLYTGYYYDNIRKGNLKH